MSDENNSKPTNIFPLGINPYNRAFSDGAPQAFTLAGQTPPLWPGAHTVQEMEKLGIFNFETQEERQSRLANELFGSNSQQPSTEAPTLFADQAMAQINKATHILKQAAKGAKSQTASPGSFIPKEPIYMPPLPQQTTKSAWARAADIGTICLNVAFLSVVAVGTAAAISPQAKEVLLKLIP